MFVVVFRRQTERKKKEEQNIKDKGAKLFVYKQRKDESVK